MNKEDRIQKVNQAIEWVGLTNKRNSKPNMLSGGECQRTAIARALVHDPVLVMADEPTANLDAENSHNIMKILTKLNKELDTSFVFATHDEKIMGYLKPYLSFYVFLRKCLNFFLQRGEQFFRLTKYFFF